MPTYAHACEQHGEFEDIRPISQSAEKAACPSCGLLCGRIVTVPHFRSMDRGTRIAHERNEQSRHAPHVCHSGCSHQHTKKKSTQSANGKPKLESYAGPRPWVIEHGCT